MSIVVRSARRIAAPAGLVYDIIADYREGHPSILPPRWFGPLTVVDGGRGAGTRVRFSMRGMGRERPMEAIVAEPQPGRVLTETYPASGGVTTFVVDAAVDGCTVTFETTWTPRGLAGVFERLFAPRFLRRVYADELDLLQARAEGAAARSQSTHGGL